VFSKPPPKRQGLPKSPDLRSKRQRRAGTSKILKVNYPFATGRLGYRAAGKSRTLRGRRLFPEPCSRFRGSWRAGISLGRSHWPPDPSRSKRSRGGTHTL